MRNKLIITLILSILFVGCICLSSVKATTDTTMVEMDVLNSSGESMVYFPPESGGVGCILNTDLDYSNCTYKMYLSNNYGDEIETDFGTFTFLEQSGSNYIYTCAVSTTDITSKSGEYDLIFSATNLDTNEVDTLDAWFLFYTIGFEENATLTIGETDFIKNGEIVNDVLFVDSTSGTVVYDESRNCLSLYNYSGDVYYCNMGSTFNIDTSGSCDINISCEDTETGIKFDASNSNLPKTVQLVVDEVTDGTIYSTVTTTLNGSATKFYIYDISLQNAGVSFQPSGTVKISIPLSDDIDTSNLVVYRISDSGEKTEYAVTIETIDGIEYATFETDHFSTYVLAELTTTNVTETEETIETETSTEHVLDDEPKTGSMNIVVFIGAVLGISLVGYVICKKKMYK